MSVRHTTTTTKTPTAAATTTANPAHNPTPCSVKPHACNEKVQALVSEKLAGFGITIKAEGLLEAAEIDEKKLIDVHYGAIANRAVMTPVAELNVPP